MAEKRAHYARNRADIRIRQAAYYAANRDAILRQIKEYTERNREAVRAYQRDYYVAHSAVLRARLHAQYAEKRAEIRERNERYRKAHPEIWAVAGHRRRARKANAVCEHGPDCVTKELLAQLIDERCLYCDAPARHADHFEPLARGGLNCRDNIVPACGPCNWSKGSSDPWEWIETRLKGVA